MYDKVNDLLHINPGAAGKEGFHKIRTIVLLKINDKNISDLKVVELGIRAKLSNPVN